MKKFITIMIALLGFAVISFAQIKTYTAYEFTMRINDEWCPWEANDCKIDVDFDHDTVTIHSYIPQIYTITGITTPPPDNRGEQKAFTCVNNDGESCRLRFRIQTNGRRQIYIDNFVTNTVSVYSLK